MANLNLYLASCVLLLTLSCRTSTGVPVPADSLSAEQCVLCASLFKDLLLNITELLKSDDLCFGIKSDAVVMRSKAETALVCAPNPTQNSSSCVMQRHSPFSEGECIKNIMRDLKYHHAAIQSYLERQLRSPEQETRLLTPTLGKIKNLMENCSLNGKNGENEDFSEVQWENSTFDNRQAMCKMMKGFYVRTITINRAMGYICSGDHRK
ncbi:interleukin-12 subunit alpha [Anabas testudineus]|uniref:Interleukin-12 subunit alpha n=1 Tax=Anabas testudineus TaxID=64144 RepID=A0A3Q1IMM4_ANATE|nr:interleukin-12 subunit alpha [Anabas testudineus]